MLLTSLLLLLLLVETSLATPKCIFIHNAGELIQFSNDVNNGTSYLGYTVYLVNDIDFTGLSQEFKSIGNNINYFNGTFDGQGYVISNLKTTSSLLYDGLFGYSGGTAIKNVVIDDSCSITNSGNNGDQEYGPYVGGIIGSCSSATSELCIVESCVNMGNVTYNGSSANLYVGGIAGAITASENGNKTMIVNCVNYGTLSASGTISVYADIGGIVAEIWIRSPSYSAYVLNCINFGSIKNMCSGGSYNIGGIDGNSHGSTIENCVNVGTISSDNGNVGGIIGQHWDSDTTVVSHCYWANQNSYSGMSSTQISTSDLQQITSLNSSLVNNLNDYALSKGWKEWTFNENSNKINFVLYDGKEFSYSSQLIIVPEPTRRGYTFLFWCVNQNSNDKCNIEYVRSTTTFTTDTTLYAQWNPNNYTVILDVNGGSELANNTTTVTFNSIYGYLPTPNKDRYMFSGWYTEDNVQITEDTVVNITSTQTLYAQWIIKNFTVILDVNGGNELDNNTFTVTFNSLYGYLPTPDRDGYTFSGWYTKNNENITEDTVVKITSTQTLYAQWNPNIYTVILDVNGGSELDNNTITVTFNSVYGYLPTPDKDGYDFAGWFTEDNVQITESTVVKITSTQTLYAQWTEIKTSESVTSSKYVEIVFGKESLTDEEIKRIINKFTDVNFEIVKVDDSKSGETTVIIKFNDVTEAENFVTTINLSSSSEKNFVISVGYNLGSVVSFSAMLYPFALLSFLLKL